MRKNFTGYSAGYLVSAGAAAKIMSVSPGTLRRWRETGKGPDFFMIGSRVKYDRRDLEEWINENKIEVSSTDKSEN